MWNRKLNSKQHKTMIKYQLTYDRKDYRYNDKIFPDYSLVGIINRDSILSDYVKPQVDDFFKEGQLFAPLVPKYRGKFEDIVGDYRYRTMQAIRFKGYEEAIKDNSEAYKVHALPDFGTWIDVLPRGIIFPISAKFKYLIEDLNLPDHRFFEAQTLFKEKLVNHYVFQLNLKYHYDLIDFEQSEFCNWSKTENRGIGEEVENVRNIDELQKIEKEKDWEIWGYHKAVMKEEFAQLDIVQTYQFGTLISEKLKNRIEEFKLTGISIKECPVEFYIGQA